MEYRLPEITDQDALEEYIAEHYSNGENEIHASNMLTSMNYDEWVKKIKSNLIQADKDWGRSYTYLAIDNNTIIGLLNIRPELSTEMQMKYGNIGYGVRPSKRKMGYATQMLQFAIAKCKEIGMKEVILGCYKSNEASARTILKNGGSLIKEISEDGEISQYYEIEIQKEIGER